MNIFIDESGSFVSAPNRDSWNCIVAYMTPEFDRKQLQGALSPLKLTAGLPSDKEVKLNQLCEERYFEFLHKLGKLNGVLFSVATDAGMNQDTQIQYHKDNQVDLITKHKQKMKYKSGRESLQLLSDQVRGLSPQLYVQLQCQVMLISLVVRYGTLYFVSRYPKSLSRFRWRIDQKNSTQTEYETALLNVAPALLQSSTLKDPMPMLVGADYSSFSRFEYARGTEPTYLQEDYGIDQNTDAPSLNIGFLMREDLQLVDSRDSWGVQIADLLAAGLRRTLRHQFNDNRRAASLLGRLMTQRENNNPPVYLLTLSALDQFSSSSVTEVVQLMQSVCRPMLTPSGSTSVT